MADPFDEDFFGAPSPAHGPTTSDPFGGEDFFTAPPGMATEIVNPIITAPVHMVDPNDFGADFGFGSTSAVHTAPDAFDTFDSISGDNDPFAEPMFSSAPSHPAPDPFEDGEFFTAPVPSSSSPHSLPQGATSAMCFEEFSGADDAFTFGNSGSQQADIPPVASNPSTEIIPAGQPTGQPSATATEPSSPDHPSASSPSKASDPTSSISPFGAEDDTPPLHPVAPASPSQADASEAFDAFPTGAPVAADSLGLSSSGGVPDAFGSTSLDNFASSDPFAENDASLFPVSGVAATPNEVTSQAVLGDAIPSGDKEFQPHSQEERKPSQAGPLTAMNDGNDDFFAPPASLAAEPVSGGPPPSGSDDLFAAPGALGLQSEASFGGAAAEVGVKGSVDGDDLFAAPSSMTLQDDALFGVPAPEASIGTSGNDDFFAPPASLAAEPVSGGPPPSGSDDLFAAPGALGLQSEASFGGAAAEVGAKGSVDGGNDDFFASPASLAAEPATGGPPPSGSDDLFAAPGALGLQSEASFGTPVRPTEQRPFSVDDFGSFSVGTDAAVGSNDLFAASFGTGDAKDLQPLTSTQSEGLFPQSGQAPPPDVTGGSLFGIADAPPPAFASKSDDAVEQDRSRSSSFSRSSSATNEAPDVPVHTPDQPPNAAPPAAHPPIKEPSAALTSPSFDDDGSDTLSDAASGASGVHAVEANLEKARREIVDLRRKNAKLEEQVVQLEKELQRSQHLQVQLMLLHGCILNSTCGFVGGASIASVILYRTLRHWDAFSPGNGEEAFRQNIILAFTHVTEDNAENPKALATVMSVISGLIAQLVHQPPATPVARRTQRSVSPALGQPSLPGTCTTPVYAVSLTTPYLQQKIANTVLELHKDSCAKSDWDLCRILRDNAEAGSVLSTRTSSHTLDNEADAVDRYCQDLLRISTLAYYFLLQFALKHIELHVNEDIFGPMMDGGSSAVALTKHVLDVFDTIVTACKECHVPKPTTTALLNQMVSHIDALIFNKILKGGHYCSPTSSLRVKMFVSSIESWLHQPTGPHAADASALTFQYTRQACVLLLLNKDIIRNAAIRQDVCPQLSLHYVLHIIEAVDRLDGTGACRDILRDLRNQLKEEPKKMEALMLKSQQYALTPRWSFSMLPEYMYITPPAKFDIPALQFLWPQQQ